MNVIVRDTSTLAQVALASRGIRIPLPVLGLGRPCYAADGRLFAPMAGGAGFASYDQIITALTTNATGQRIDFNKTSLGATVQASSYDLWQAGGQPAAGTFGTALTGRHIDGTYAAGMDFTNPTAPATLHLLSFGAGSTVSLGTLLLYDRVYEYPFTGTVLSGTFVAPTLQARDAAGATAGAGLYMMLETFSATARAAVTVTPSYTNSAGTASRTNAFTSTAGTALAGGLSNPTGSPFIIPLASGDVGVRSIQSYTLSASALAANMCLTIFRPLAYLPVLAAQSYVERDLVLQLAGLPRIYNDSALSLMLISNTTSAPAFGQVAAASN